MQQIRLDTRGKKFGGKEGEYHTPQSQKLVQDKQGTVMQIDLGAAMSQMGDMEREIQAHEGCRYSSRRACSASNCCLNLCCTAKQGCLFCCSLLLQVGHTRNLPHYDASTAWSGLTDVVLLPCCCCRMVGDISVRRVAGKLHFAVHQQSFVDVLPQVRVHVSGLCRLWHRC